MTGGVPSVTVRVAAISAGPHDTCAIRATGTLECWGAGANYASGIESTSKSLAPVGITSLSSDVLAVSAGVSTCAVTSGGAVKCWGGLENSLLGPRPGSRFPVPVEGLSADWVSVSVGSQVACTLSSTGRVKCWGTGNVGNNTSSSAAPVTAVGLLSGVSSVSVGLRHACALTSAGAVKCWGPNDVGQVGDGSIELRAVPVDVVGLSSGVVSVAAGYDHSCAVTSAGAVKCWGANFYSQLGNDSMTFSSVPVDVVGLSSGVVSISAGGRYTCAVTSAGTVKCWGSLRWGAIGFPTTTSTRPVPAEVDGLSSNITAVTVGESHTCALDSVGAVKCWGTNDFGELGNRTTTGSKVPVDVLF